VIKRLWHEIFHMVPGINPRPISALQLCCFALVPKKNNRFTVLVWNFVNFARKFRLRSLTKVDQNEWNLFLFNFVIKRLWHEIFHMVPGINPRPISALQLCCRAWYGSLGLIPGPIWKMSCNNLLIIIKSLIELPLFNLQIFLFRIWFQKYTKQCRSVQWR
jgi:hypothetical protein